MIHTVRIDSKSALVGIAAALVCVVAMGQVSVSRATTPTAAIAPGYGIGNPHPRDMVRFTSTTAINVSSVPIPADSEYEVYTVPQDRWLVVLPNQGLGNAGCPFDDGGAGTTIALYEDLNGAYTLQAIEGSNLAGVASYGPSGWATGWTFRPGSRVVLKNVGISNEAGARFNFFGYLTGL
jgi:hypothetical protein